MIKEAIMNTAYLLIIPLVIALSCVDNVNAETIYKVRKGDNPHSIAKKFNVKPGDLIRVNSIDPAQLMPGTKITIPEANNKKPSKAGSRDTAVRNRIPVDASSDDPHSLVHVVKKGDTLSSLARQYSTTPRQLMEINGMRSSKLKIGRKIAVKRPDTTEYVVQKGDTIWDIAHKFDVDQNMLTEINGLESHALKPGQKLLLKRPDVHSEIKRFEAALSQAPADEISASPSENIPPAEDGLEARLVRFAKKMLDTPYRFGGNTLLGIDCSAYVKNIYSLIGIDLPRTAREQFKEGIHIEEHELSIGDLVFFRTYASYPSHVGIYLGNNLFIHASAKKKKVAIDSLDTPFYVKRFIGAKRLLGLNSDGVNLN